MGTCDSKLKIFEALDVSLTSLVSGAFLGGFFDDVSTFYRPNYKSSECLLS